MNTEDLDKCHKCKQQSKWYYKGQFWCDKHIPAGKIMKLWGKFCSFIVSFSFYR